MFSYLVNHCRYPSCAFAIMQCPEDINGKLNDAFVVDLGGFISQSSIDYWIYGHTHLNIPEVASNGTKLLTNQLGYVKWNEH